MKRLILRALSLAVCLAMLCAVSLIAVPATSPGLPVPGAVYSYTDDSKLFVRCADDEFVYPVQQDSTSFTGRTAPYITVGEKKLYLIDELGNTADVFGFLSIIHGFDGNYVLMNDITVPEQTQNFMVDRENNNAATFTGSLEGNGKSITYTLVLNSTSLVQGLFVWLDGTAAIRNLTVNANLHTGANGIGLKNKGAVAGVVGEVKPGASGVVIERVTVNMQADLYYSGSGTGTVYGVAGIAGLAKGVVTIRDCTVNGNVSFQSGVSQYGYVAGVVYQAGVHSELTIQNCTTRADLTVTAKNGCAAGILGCFAETIEKDGEGKVTAVYTVNSVRLENCTNAGALSAALRACAITGYARKTLSSGGLLSCYKMIGCTNTGTLTLTGENGKGYTGLADYSLADYRCGVITFGDTASYIAATGASQVRNHKGTAQFLATLENPCYIVLLSDIDVDGAFVAKAIDRFVAKGGIIDFAGHTIRNAADTTVTASPNLIGSALSLREIKGVVPVGIQLSEVKNGRYDLRAIAVLDDYERYGKIEVRVTLKPIGASEDASYTETFTVTDIYSSVLAGTKNPIKLEPAAFGGRDMLVVTVRGLTQIDRDMEVTISTSRAYQNSALVDPDTSITVYYKANTAEGSNS